jgi:hypothetical protein
MIELDDLKRHLNSTDEADDELLTGKVTAASEWVLAPAATTPSSPGRKPGSRNARRDIVICHGFRLAPE